MRQVHVYYELHVLYTSTRSEGERSKPNNTDKFCKPGVDIAHPWSGPKRSWKGAAWFSWPLCLPYKPSMARPLHSVRCTYTRFWWSPTVLILVLGLFQGLPTGLFSAQRQTHIECQAASYIRSCLTCNMLMPCTVWIVTVSIPFCESPK